MAVRHLGFLSLFGFEHLCAETRVWLASDAEHTERELQTRLVELADAHDNINAVLAHIEPGPNRQRLELIEDDLDDLTETIAFGLSVEIRADIAAAMREAGIMVARCS